jgi:hypothetical protein
VIEWVGAMGWAGQRLIIIPSLNMLMLVNAWSPDRYELPGSCVVERVHFARGLITPID